MSDPIVIEPLSPEPLFIEPLVAGAPVVIALSTIPGPFGPLAITTTTVSIIIDGIGGVIIPGDKADLPMHFDGRITGWELIGDLAGNCVLDVLKGDPVNGVPYASVTGGNPPQLTAVAAAIGDAVGWNTDFVSGEVFRFHVQSLTVIRRLTAALFVERLE